MGLIARLKNVNLVVESVIVYDVARTVHLERHRGKLDRRVFYRRTSYDFDHQSTDMATFRRAGIMRTAYGIARLRPRMVELNEPAVWRAWPALLFYVSVIVSLNLVRQQRIKIVCYAIENLDPVTTAINRLRGGCLVRLVVPAVARLIGQQYDRVAFGTDGARDCYFDANFLRPAVANSSVVFPALPSVCDCPGHRSNTPSVLFLGTLDDRKGFMQLMEAWTLLSSRVAGAQLTIVGDGKYVETAVAAAHPPSNVTYHARASRTQIHNILRRAHVLVLFSQRQRFWREQVGLPILEGLAHGCEIICSDETGIADWLTAHDHVVLPAAAPAEAIAEALQAVLTKSRTPEKIVVSLPVRDTRLQAEDWLYA